MSYQPQWDSVSGRVLQIAQEMRERHPWAWEALTQKDPAFIKLVAAECQRIGINAACNGKRGNVHDLSCDVLAFPNPTGCRDASGTHAGLELRDIIYAAEDPRERHLTWGDSTAGTIAGGVPGAWVWPDGVVQPPPPQPPADPIAVALQQIAEMHPVIMGLKKYL